MGQAVRKNKPTTGRVVEYSVKRSGNSKRIIQKQDVELWDLHRERVPSRHRKADRSHMHRQGNPRPVQSIKRRRAKRRKVYLYRTIALSVIVLCLILIYFMTGAIYRAVRHDTGKGVVQILSDNIIGKRIAPPEIKEDYLEINEYSRPGTELKKVKSIFVHYTANAGTTAEQNRSYFENLAQTYDTLIHTLAWLIDKYDLSTDDILRHYDCGGKLCPLYYAEHEDAWDQLRRDVADYENPEDIH